jgi:hypothetical protein
MNPATPGSPAVPGSFDRSGFREQAVGQGVDLDQINEYLAGMGESEKKAFKSEMEDFGNGATWVLYGGDPSGIMQRYKAAMQYFQRSGKDTTRFQGLQTPDEVGAALSPFIDQINQIRMGLAKEVSSRQIRKSAASGKGSGTKTKTVQIAEWMIKNLKTSPEEAFEFATEFESRGKFNRKAATVQLKNSSFMSDDEIEQFLDFADRLSPSDIPPRKDKKPPENGNPVIKYDAKGNRIQ